MDMPGWEITTESTKANPAPAATIDSRKVCAINTTMSMQKHGNQYDFLLNKCIFYPNELEYEVSIIEWLAADTLNLGKQEKAWA
jgi:hypothetical protein